MGERGEERELVEVECGELAVRGDHAGVMWAVEYCVFRAEVEVVDALPCEAENVHRGPAHLTDRGLRLEHSREKLGTEMCRAGIFMAQTIQGSFSHRSSPLICARGAC